MIEIRNLTKAFGDHVVLDGIDITIDEGDIFGLIGVSGAGKSTLLRCINRLEDFGEGSLIVDGTEVKSLRKQELRNLRRNIGMVFQQFSLMERKTVYENVYFPLKCRGDKKDAVDGKIRDMLELVGLSDKLGAFPRELSGGQKQRVAIARALVTDPTILLCDEATSALDPNITEAVLDLLKKINRELGLTIVVVTHEVSVMKSVCNKMGLLSGGQLKAVGTVEHFFLENPALLNEFMSNAGGSVPAEEDFTTLRVLQRGTVTGSLLPEVAIKTGIAFEITSGGIDRYQGRTAGAFNIRVRTPEIPALTSELTARDVEWKVV